MGILNNNTNKCYKIEKMRSKMYMFNAEPLAHLVKNAGFFINGIKMDLKDPRSIRMVLPSF